MLLRRPSPHTSGPASAPRAHRLAATAAVLLALALSGCGGSGAPKPSDGSDGASSASARPSSEKSAVPSPGAEGLDTTTPSSLAVLVDKTHPMNPKEWAPKDLEDVGGVPMRREAAEHARDMIAAAGKDGIPLTLISGYRSYDTQRQTYQGWVDGEGQKAADTASARPGYSEHQTGLAMDLGGSGSCDLHPCFAQTEQARWAAQHAAEHGFILRFPWQEQRSTGYWYESWHFRYVGEKTARAYADSGAKTWEQFLGAPPAPDYSTR